MPERRAKQRHALDQHVLTAVGPDQRWTQKMLCPIRLDPVDALFDRRHRSPERDGDSALLLEAEAVRACRSGKRPPCHRNALRVRKRAGLSVQRARAGDRNVGLAKRIDERRVVVQIIAFPARQHVRILARIGAELERRAFDQVKVDATAQTNSPR